MSAPTVHVPSPRRPGGPAPRVPGPSVPAPRQPEAPGTVLPGGLLGGRPGRRLGGRHRAVPAPGRRGLQVAARAGSLTTLVAMLVLATAVAGLADGRLPTGPAADVATATLP